MTIDPGIITFIQNSFLEQIGNAFTITAHYASNLLYIFTTLEVVILGLMWAMQRDVGWSKLVFKVINIGLIYYIIQNYSWLISIILDSFAQLAGVVIDNAKIAEYVFSPANIWQYGYDVGVHLLQLATASNLFGLSMTHLVMGFGILLVFGLLGIQMILRVVGFYCVAFSSLIILPFGALNATRGWFDSTVQAVLKAGLKLMVLIIVIGVAVVTWEGFNLNELSATTDFNINQPLGLFFTALLFLCLARYLPKVVSEVIGDLSNNILPESSKGNEGGPVWVGYPSWQGGQVVTTIPSTAGSGLADLQAATTISTGSSGQEGFSGSAAAATIATSTNAAPLSGVNSQSAGDALRATTLSKSISDVTVKRLKETIVKAVQEKNKG